MTSKFTSFNTEYGWIAAIKSPAGVFRVTLPRPDERSAIDAVTRGMNASRDEAELEDVKRTLTNYFKSEHVEFSFPLDLKLEGHTDFQRDVWEATAEIPYGQLRSYGWIADHISRPGAARAVGQALGANPLPIIIPCHRVVRSDGSLGGFSGGLHWKERLIELEHAVFVT